MRSIDCSESNSSMVNIDTMTVSDLNPHFHDDYEIVYVLCGSVMIMNDGRTETVREGEIFVINCDSIHAIYHTREKNSIMIMHPSSKRIVAISPDFLRIRVKQHLYRPKDCKAYDALMNHFSRLSYINAHPQTTVLLSKTQLLCDICITLSERIDHIMLTGHKRIREIESAGEMIRILNYIDMNYMYNPSLADIKRHCNLATSSVSRFFKETMHETYRSYLTNVKLRAAVQMLDQRDKSLLDICMECGFSSPESFNRTFRNKFGIRPNEYE